MTSKLTKNHAALLSLLILLITTIISLTLFFKVFNGPLSVNHEIWGAFGSFISGTIGVIAACTAVIWLIISVHLQKTELEQLKNELVSSANEQKKQTNISALSALINSSRLSIASYQNDLIALNSGEKHLHPMDDEQSIHQRIDEEWRRLSFYQSAIESYLEQKYVKKTEPIDDSPPF